MGQERAYTSYKYDHYGTAITQISKCRLWLMRLFAMIFIPLFVLGGIELGLRLTGYGYDYGFFYPNPDQWP